MKLLFILLSVGSLLLHHGAYSVDSDELSVMEGDSVTLHICVEKKKEEVLKWYFNKILIARISGHPNETCTDVQCKAGNERFRDRLKLDHHTGSLTIMNITNTHSGEYTLKNNSGRHNSEKIFSVTVHGVRDGEREKMKKMSVKEGDPVTLDPDEIKNPSDVMWYFNGNLIAPTPGDQSKTYTDVKCDERFRDRLKLDNQTGSLTIMNIRNTDSGHYICEVQRNSNRKRRSISNNVEFFEVNINPSGLSPADPASGLSSLVAGICVSLLMVVVVAVVIFRRRRNAVKVKEQATASEESPMNEMEKD